MTDGGGVLPVPRMRPPDDGTERETLTRLLEFLRATAVLKVAGLSDAEAFSASAPPSTLTPAGVIKHLAGTERFWFSIDFAAADVPWPWSDDDPHGTSSSAPPTRWPTSSLPTGTSACALTALSPRQPWTIEPEAQT